MAVPRRSPTPTRRCRVQHDLAQRFQGSLEEHGGLLADVLVRRAVKAVAANVPLCGDIPIDGVRRGGGRQVVEERGVEHRDLRQIGQYSAGHLDAMDGGRVVQGCQRCDGFEGGDQRVVHQRRPVQVGAAVHDAVSHGSKAEVVEAPTGVGQFVERRA